MDWRRLLVTLKSTALLTAASVTVAFVIIWFEVSGLDEPAIAFMVITFWTISFGISQAVLFGQEELKPVKFADQLVSVAPAALVLGIGLLAGMVARLGR